jgi:glutamyl-tRNA synthetase
LPVEPIADRAQLVDTFDLAHFGRAPARFDDAELERLNAAIVHQMDYSEVHDRLPAGMTEAGWLAIRPNLAHVGGAADWWTIITGPVEVPELPDEDRAFVAEAARTLSWSDDPWHTLTDALKVATGRKGRALFHPLRLALTGRDSGPDMKALLPLIGEDEAQARLERAADL